MGTQKHLYSFSSTTSCGEQLTKLRERLQSVSVPCQNLFIRQPLLSSQNERVYKTVIPGCRHYPGQGKCEKGEDTLNACRFSTGGPALAQNYPMRTSSGGQVVCSRPYIRASWKVECASSCNSMKCSSYQVLQLSHDIARLATETPAEDIATQIAP